MTREELEAKMAVLLGGRAAEELVFGHLSTGAADDLAKVTDIARSMVTRYAMFPELGPLAYETEPTGFLAGVPQVPRRLYSEETAREIDLAIRGLVEAAMGERAGSWRGTAACSRRGRGSSSRRRPSPMPSFRVSCGG